MAKYFNITSFSGTKYFPVFKEIVTEMTINLDHIVRFYNEFDPMKTIMCDILMVNRHIVMTTGEDFIIGEDEWDELTEMYNIKETEWIGYKEWKEANPEWFEKHPDYKDCDTKFVEE